MATTLSPDTTDLMFQENANARQRYRHAETINAQTGEWVILPAGVEEIMVSVAPASGTARVEYTQGTVADAEAGTATQRAWDAGDVSVYTASVMSNTVTAIRCVASASCAFVVTA
ncbi:hypothetical protein [Marinobacter salarius]|jgi:uncharacterized protein YjlB|uniref:hypothetical protein n=1 Tax=Marinobacter salarius TaxID=1420917 RepID=UPI0010A9968A|nr:MULTISPECIES: hypothetical protein [Marinobacter]MBJ7302721.1 hypothetical protein [Marinobacter salarius]HIO30734.1 hypothetical protein [Marinobacter salarius]HIP01767.1 hypothetical protein [Marinobacter salarius]